MTAVVWVDESVVLAVHDEQLAEHGGAPGVRDPGLLSSALARPRNLIAYGDADLAALAAAYGHGVLRNHPFIDGNKRVAFVVCRTFLLLNGKDLNATREEKYETFLKLARGDLPEEDLAAWIRGRLVPRG